MESYPTDAITLTIDEKEVKAKKGMTVLEAALGANMYIPNLCYHPDLSPSGACRLCIVQINGIRGLPTACTTPAENGMIVHTDSPEISRIRRAAFQLLIASHPTDCLTCNENQRCELQILAAYLGITEQPFRKTNEKVPVDLRNPLFVRDPNKCILCGRCVRICQDARKVGAISFMKRGTDTFIGSAFDRPYA
ncbi:2Fe-2S iron-sulfur cluster binding domain-containing protein, partial [bacterium]